jgi:protein O-GlcNAc transferase
MTSQQRGAGQRDVAELYALAVAQQRSGETLAAVETYRHCLALSPLSPEIHNNLGTALEQAGRVTEAVECFQRALALNPGYARPLVNLGKILRLQERLAEAIPLLERALAISPDNPAALTNLGFALTDLGRRQEAIRLLRRAIALDPNLAEAHDGLGRALLQSGDAAAACESLQLALTLKPSLLDAYLPLATSLLILQRLPEALALIDAVLAARPDDADALGEALNCSTKLCDWRRVERTLERLRCLPSGISQTTPFVLMGVSDDPEEHLQAARSRTTTIMRHLATAIPTAAVRRHEKIRVAYVSRDFFTHATSFLVAELLELHDRSAFDIFGVSFGPDDGSPLRSRVLAALDTCLDARDRSDLEVATWLREHEIDIAVDLKGYTAFARPGIFALRPAPIQVSYLGFPGTMAAPFIDYLIADSFVIPEAEQHHYTEKIAYLPNSYQVNDRRRQVSERTPTRLEMGLPEEGFVFCCFNNSWKITAPVFDVWMRLLASVPGSVLWLLEDNPWAIKNLRREATARGVAAERLIVCGRASNEVHLARHRVADLFLDTFPYNAHTTASDALWAGLPVLTCSGRTFASRVGGSLLRAVGLSELVTTSLENYESLALQLAGESGRLKLLRTRLARDREKLHLFDTPDFCKHLEAAYRHMCSTHGEQGGGQPLDHRAGPGGDFRPGHATRSASSEG